MLNLTILIVDDEQHIREGIANSIQWHGLKIDKVLQAVDGKQALDIAFENKIDFLLSDIRMPVIDGIELSKKLLEIHPDCIIIFMSAYSDKEYLMSAIKLKAINYIEKPIQIARLKEAIHEAVKTYREIEYNKLKRIILENDLKISIPLIKNEIALLSTIKNTDMELLLDCIKNEMLGIKADLPYITVILKTFDFFSSLSDNINRAKTEFFKELSETFSSHNLNCFWGTRDEEEYILHIYGTYGYPRPEPKQIISILKEWIIRYKNKKIFISIGTIASDFTKIYQSYSCARSALNKCFYSGYGSIVHYSQGIIKSVIVEKDMVEAFNRAIETGSQENAYALLQDFSVQLRRYEYQDVDAVRNIYCKFMVNLLDNLQNYDVPSLYGYENDNSLRNKIYSINTLDELENFCLSLMKAYFETIQKIKSSNSISMIIQYIEKNYTRKTLDINKISQNTFLTPAYLCTYFKKETGQTINQYLTDYRLKKAIELLANSNYSISDIAELVGYDNNYFARIFKKKFGASPSEYRERMQTV